MSALDEYLNDEKYEPELYDADGWKLLDQARAELAQLRASAEAERYWQETAEQERCNAAEQRERAEKLRATVAEQARQLAEARKIIEFSQQAILNQVSDGCPFCLELAGWETVGDITRMTTITHRTTCPIVITGKWLAANPAPAPEPQS